MKRFLFVVLLILSSILLFNSIDREDVIAEFDPLKIEIDYNSGKKTCNVFYCKPYSSFQKPNIERNHEYIRRVFPKGTSLNNLTTKQVQRLETTINNIPRDKFDGKTPYEMTKKLFPELLNKLNYEYINPDDVSLTLKYVLGDK